MHEVSVIPPSEASKLQNGCCHLRMRGFPWPRLQLKVHIPGLDFLGFPESTTPAGARLMYMTRSHS
jgi:hypothetical protein